MKPTDLPPQQVLEVVVEQASELGQLARQVPEELENMVVRMKLADDYCGLADAVDQLSRNYIQSEQYRRLFVLGVVHQMLEGAEARNAKGAKCVYAIGDDAAGEASFWAGPSPRLNDMLGLVGNSDGSCIWELHDDPKDNRRIYRWRRQASNYYDWEHETGYVPAEGE